MMHADRRRLTAPRPAYEAPRVRRLGTVEAWTKGNVQGAFTDRAFPAHTPVVAITFTNS